MRSPAALEVTPVSRLFKALADEDRVRIVALLTHGELCVCHLEAALGQSQPSVSRHLAALRSAGVVESRRDGNWVYYRLAPQADADCRRQLRALSGAALARDVRRLVKAKGPGACR
jgi:ArsR family transcriptional regulator